MIIQEHTSAKYTPRTYFNAKSADLTIAMAANLNTAGEISTKKAAGDNYIGFEIYKEIDYLTIARPLYKRMKQNMIKSLNIAGNGIYTLTQFNIQQEDINALVFKVIKQVHQFYPIEKIYTGGQTGVDLAGAIAANSLGISAIITLPKGYIQRFEDKVDRVQSKEIIEQQIEHYTKLLLLQNKKMKP